MREAEYFKAGIRILFIACLLFFTGCYEPVPTEAPSLLDSSNDYGQNPEEQKLISQAKEIEQRMRDDGMILQDDVINEYLNSVGQKLIPESVKGQVNFHFAVVKDPAINAFSMPNGGIYFHTGLLARLKNESQVAFVSAHEIAHVTERHMLETLRNLQNKTVEAKWAEMLVLPMMIPSGGPNGLDSVVRLNYLAAVNGYGRDKEKEADEMALKWIMQAGYDANAAIGNFDAMNEIREPGKLELYYYSDHPSNEARRQYLKEMIQSEKPEGGTEGYIGAELYEAAVQELLMENIKLRLSRRHYKYALDEVDLAMKRLGETAELDYYSGEGYRLMAEDPRGAAKEQAMRRLQDVNDKAIAGFKAKSPEYCKAAEEAYQKALALDPSFAPAHRGMGFLAFNQGNKEDAKRELEAYLNSSEKIWDYKYIRKILEELAK